MKILYYGTSFGHAPGEWCAKRIFEHYTFCYFLTPYMYEKNEKILRGDAGDFLIIPPKCVVHHGPAPEMEKGFSNDWLYVSGEEIDSLLSRYPLPLFEPFKVSSPELLQRCISMLNSEFEHKKAGFEEKNSLTVSSFIIDLWRSYISENTKDRVSARLERARDRLLKDVSVNIPLSELADTAGYSQSRFCTLYVEKYGVTPKADLMRERISASKRLLKFSELSIDEIALTLGFGSICHFSKYFKKAIGTTPSKYRNQTICK